ncbi:MAG: HSPB1-associated protein 1-like isoform [Myxococcales bacterium]|nr:HSPB1-associated protein 1-like isoform [Myxococcales bacterium]
MGMNATFPTNPARKLSLPEVENVDGPEARELIRQRVAFRCKVKDWKLRDWSLPYLKQRVGHVKREFIRVADHEHITVTTAEFLSWLEHDPGWKSKHMPAGFVGPPIAVHDPQYAVLLDDFVLPSYVTKSWGGGIMIRNSRANAAGAFYDTPCHYEDNVRPALYIQIAGKKTLWLFAPDQAPYLGVEPYPHVAPYISNMADACASPDRYPEIANATCYEIALEPGDIVHWPEFWFHWFVHQHDFQMNLRLDWDPPSFELNRLSASWAYVNGLAKALGGFEGLDKKFTALPEEVQALLVRIERHLINDPLIVDGRAMTLERFRAGGQGVDTTAYTPPVK